MHIKSIVAAAAIALAASIGSASAAEQFDTLAGITAELIPEAVMADVVGTGGRPGTVSHYLNLLFAYLESK